MLYVMNFEHTTQAMVNCSRCRRCSQKRQTKHTTDCCKQHHVRLFICCLQLTSLIPPLCSGVGLCNETDDGEVLSCEATSGAL